MPFPIRAVAVAAVAIACACSRPEPDPVPPDAAPRDDRVPRAIVVGALDAAFDRARLLADSIDEILLPAPLLTPAEEGELRRYSSAAQLERARSLGARVRAGAIDSLVAAGTLVPLDDSTRLWVVRELEHSVAFVTPDTRAMLVTVAEHFQRRLLEIGLPPFRLEVTSVLRTAEQQESLRATNPNAARGTSTHELAASLDVAYSAFAAPAGDNATTGTPPWLVPYAERIAALALETAAARKSRELQAILGRVLIALQRQGALMVTLERQQPVYHLTVASRYPR